MLNSISGTMSHNAYNKNYEMKEKGSVTSNFDSQPDYSIGSSAIDPSSGVFFNSDYRRHEDLKEMLDSNKDNLKLEAMKRIIGMIAKGRDASSLFPAVVKNVVSKNVELKKLVYSYLERYAEEKDDLALLSISTFQRALKEPNQLIRAGALRVLSGIRVPMIAPIVMIAIRDAAADMSPYVRKTAAHAIPKLYSLDNDTKSELIVIIEKLLADRTVLVIGSAVMAFTKVCPERVDLIHKVYRKLCALLGDVDEWGQVIIVNMLTRYARTQFTDPNIHEKEAEVEQDEKNAFYEQKKSRSESDDSNNNDDDDEEDENSDRDILQAALSPSGGAPILDADHRLLLRSARPLLQSRNAAVVMAVAQMYHHIGPKSETIPAVKALIRLLRSNAEVQELVLNCIVTMTLTKKGVFDIYLKSFFVRTSDSKRVKLLKLTILTNIANESNISVILRELETYISSYDDDFVAATIQAIGRCACFISAVTDTCLSGLVTLLSNKNEVVVAESVVVIKRLLQTKAANPRDIIQQMIRLLDNIEVPQARASIIWLLGEHCRDLPTASNVLKKAAKSFASEQDIVKLQVLNLAVKLYIHDKLQYELICQYIFNLAKYDQNYDIRDRARLLRNFIELNANANNKLLMLQAASKIFLATKPAPTYRSNEGIKPVVILHREHHKHRRAECRPNSDTDQYQLGSLSHSINAKAIGYEPLPSWPDIAPPNDVREVAFDQMSSFPDAGATAISHADSSSHRHKKQEDFESWESEHSSSDEETESGGKTETSSTEESTSSSEKSDSSSSSLEEDDDDDDDSEDDVNDNKKKEVSSSDDNDQKKSDESEDESISEEKPVEKPAAQKSVQEKSNLDLLLDLDLGGSGVGQPLGPVLTPSFGGFLSPINATNTENANDQTNSFINKPDIEIVPPKQNNNIPAQELLSKINGKGLIITYRYTRNPHLFSPCMVNVNLSFINANNEEIKNIRLGQKNLSPGMSVHEFACIQSLPVNCTLPGTLGIDFNDSMHPANLEIVSSVGTSNVSIKPTVGEMLRPVTMNEVVFSREQAKLRGMNEHAAVITLDKSQSSNFDSYIKDKIYLIANVGSCPCSDSSVYRFGAQTLASSSMVLITLNKKSDDTDEPTINLSAIVNCEKLVIGSMLLNEIKSALEN